MGGAVVAAALFAGYRMARASFSLAAALEAWDQLVVVGLLGGGLTALGLMVSAASGRQTWRRLAGQIDQWRQKPNSVHHSDEELEPLLAPIESLCQAYQQALEERAALAESLDALRPIHQETQAKLQRRARRLAEGRAHLHKVRRDLERLKESYKDLYHHAPVMFFSLDPQAHFVSCNDTMLRALGYSRDDLIGKPYSRLFPPALPKTADPKGNPFSREGEEGSWLKKDGTIIDVWIRTVPIQDDRGNFVRSRSAALDVTLRNRLSQELRQRGDELERANLQLRQSNRELEEFTSVVSHDLKEPLRTIEAYSNSLAQDFGAQLGPDGFQSINHLVQASRRLGHLINDLLSLSGAGHIKRAAEPFAFVEIVATVRRDLADLIQRKNAEVLTEVPLPTVLGDAQRFTQLLANLVANGLKYNHSLVPRVIIGAATPCHLARGQRGEGPLAREGGMIPGLVTLFVRDNGIGIDPRFHEQIFGIFRRLHSADEYEGTGAGLAICQKIVEAHGGRLWVQSALGQGATFFFTLPGIVPAGTERSLAVPRAEPAVPAHAAAETRRLLDTHLGNGAKPPRILLVEDIPEIALLTQQISQRAGHHITWLASAEEAWEYLQKDHPDLVLLDIHLPGMSGLELCRRLRARGLHDLPIALFTQSQPHEGDCQSASGANYVLTKDLLAQPQTWLRQLEEILKGRPG